MINKLVALTPDKWGLLEELGEDSTLNMEKLKVKLQDLANKRIV